MPKFSYQAIDAGGGRVSGMVEARSRSEAFQQLSRRKLQPVSLDEGGASAAEAGEQGALVAAPKGEQAPVPEGGIRLSQAQIILFSEEMSDLLDAGLQLESALKVIEERQESSALKQVARVVRQQVRDGTNFSTALRSASPSFSELYCNLMAAGEVSGTLPRILAKQCQYLNSLNEMIAKVQVAMYYPSAIVVAGVGLLILFTTVIVPQVTELVGKSGATLPWTSRALIAVGGFMESYWWAVLILIGAGVGGFWGAIQTGSGRKWWHEKQLSMPLFGKVLQARYYSQLSFTLSNLVANGIPLLKALQLVHQGTENTFFKSRLKGIAEAVSEGVPLSRAMRRSGGFPAVMLDLIGVGEQTGDLPASLSKVASRYEKEMNRRIEKITTLLPLVVIITLALVVGGMVFAIMNSLFHSISSLRAGM